MSNDTHLTSEQASQLWQEGKAAYDGGDFQSAWTTLYGLYGAQVADAPYTQAALALQIGICCRRLSRWSDAASWLEEAMSAGSGDSDIQTRARQQLRQVRLENSGDFYDLDDDEGNITSEQASHLWEEGKAAYDSGDYQSAWTTLYGLYGAQVADAPYTQAALALQIGICCRRLSRWSDAASWLEEAMSAQGGDADLQTKARQQLRQVRLENSGDFYDLDDDEGNITSQQASQLWEEGKAAYDSGDYQSAWTTLYGLYGAQVADAPYTQAALALQLGICCRRLSRWSDAGSWLEEAMSGGDSDIQTRARQQMRQVRLENSGDFYDLDDEEH